MPAIDYPPRACKFCETEFKPRRQDHVLCSVECCQKQYVKDRTERARKAAEKAAGGFPRVPCGHCGKVFVKRSTNAKYCSVKCAEVMQELKYEQRKALERKPIHTHYCTECGGEFSTKVQGLLFCSPQCRTEAGNQNLEKQAIAAAKSLAVDPVFSAADLDLAKRRQQMLLKPSAPALVEALARDKEVLAYFADRERKEAWLKSMRAVGLKKAVTDRGLDPRIAQGSL